MPKHIILAEMKPSWQFEIEDILSTILLHPLGIFIRLLRTLFISFHDCFDRPANSSVKRYCINSRYISNRYVVTQDIFEKNIMKLE